MTWQFPNQWTEQDSPCWFLSGVSLEQLDANCFLTRSQIRQCSFHVYQFICGPFHSVRVETRRLPDASQESVCQRRPCHFVIAAADPVSPAVQRNEMMDVIFSGCVTTLEHCVLRGHGQVAGQSLLREATSGCRICLSVESACLCLCLFLSAITSSFVYCLTGVLAETQLIS